MLIMVIMIIRCHMVREAPAVKVRQNLGELLNEVQYKRDSVVIMKDGRRVAALIDIGLFDRIRAMESRFVDITTRIRKAFSTTGDKEFEGLIEAAVGHARRRKAPKRAP